MQTLIVIDVQNDFCPGGTLAVNDGDAVVGPINAMMPEFDLVVLTQDWHPPGHGSFASSHAGQDAFSVIDMPYGPQVLWPDHCIQNSDGAAFHTDLNVSLAAALIRKGMRPQIDSYSAFFENDRTTPTGLYGLLQDRGCRHLTFAGLATDYCVAWSALDAVRLGFDVTVELDACRAIDLKGSLAAALAEMQQAGISLRGVRPDDGAHC